MRQQDVLTPLAVRGYVVLHLPPGPNPAATLTEFTRLFAEPLFERDGAPIVAEVRPRAGFDPGSYGGTDEFLLHTDLAWMSDPLTPEVMVLYCIRPDGAGGGESLIADGWGAFTALDAEDRRVLTEHEVTFRSHFDTDVVTRRQAKVVSEVGGRKWIRFRRDLLEGQVPGAVHRFARLADSRAEAFRLEANQVLVLDNRRMLHGRQRIAGGLGSDRLLLRIHANLRRAS